VRKLKNVAAVVGLMALGAFVWDQIVSVSRAQDKKASAAVQKWEYKMLGGDDPVEARFNDLGEQGWEFVGWHGNSGRAWFKRRK
jgi:hypothetical protein